MFCVANGCESLEARHHVFHGPAKLAAGAYVCMSFCDDCLAKLTGKTQVEDALAEYGRGRRRGAGRA